LHAPPNGATSVTRAATQIGHNPVGEMAGI